MKSSTFYFIVPMVIVLGHIFVLPLVFSPGVIGLDQRLAPAQQVDVALLIAPLTSASFITVVKFAVDNRSTDFSLMPNIANPLFSVVTLVVICSFFVSLYFFIISFQRTAGASIDLLKGLVGVTEIFFGSAYAVVVSSLFGNNNEQTARPVVAPVPAPAGAARAGATSD